MRKRAEELFMLKKISRYKTRTIELEKENKKLKREIISYKKKNRCD